MNSKLWGSVSVAACLFALSVPSLADTRTEWGTGKLTGTAPMDDEALMQVSARGGIDEHAVKALQSNGKLPDGASGAGTVQTLLREATAESAERQAIQNQVKMALGATQTVINATQITGMVASVAAPAPLPPVTSLPMFGIPVLPLK